MASSSGRGDMKLKKSTISSWRLKIQKEKGQNHRNRVSNIMQDYRKHFWMHLIHIKRPRHKYYTNVTALKEWFEALQFTQSQVHYFTLFKCWLTCKLTYINELGQLHNRWFSPVIVIWNTRLTYSAMRKGIGLHVTVSCILNLFHYSSSWKSVHWVTRWVSFKNPVPHDLEKPYNYPYPFIPGL